MYFAGSLFLLSDGILFSSSFCAYRLYEFGPLPPKYPQKTSIDSSLTPHLPLKRLPYFVQGILELGARIKIKVRFLLSFLRLLVGKVASARTLRRRRAPI